MSRSVPSLLPYTLLQSVSDDGVSSSTLIFLLWRDRRTSSVESSTFWSSIVCPIQKEDNSPLDAVTRSFSEKTKGIFAPSNMVYDDEHQLETVQRKSLPKQKIEDSKIFLRKKLISGKGVTILTTRQYITYVAPVRFIETNTLLQTFGSDKGEVEWVTAQDLFTALYSTAPDNAVIVRTQSYQTTTTRSTKTSMLTLALPFTVTMRTNEARNELAAILKQFNVDVDTTIRAPPSASNDSEANDDSTPDVSGLSLSSSSSSSASAAAPSASASAAAAASPSKPTRAPETNYACRKCRKILFTDVDLSVHTEPANGGGRFAHKHIRVSEGGRRVGIECSSLFVDNIAVLGEFPPGEGNLVCSKCQTRYGAYCWSGGQCSCGEWIVPSFQVIKSKVDTRPANGPMKIAHVSFQFQRPPQRTTTTAPAATATPADSSAAATPATTTDSASAPAPTPQP